MSEASDDRLRWLNGGRAAQMTITCSDCGRTEQVGEGKAPVLAIAHAARERGWSVVPAPGPSLQVVNFCPNCRI